MAKFETALLIRWKILSGNALILSEIRIMLTKALVKKGTMISRPAWSEVSEADLFGKQCVVSKQGKDARTVGIIRKACEES